MVLLVTLWHGFEVVYFLLWVHSFFFGFNRPSSSFSYSILYFYPFIWYWTSLTVEDNNARFSPWVSAEIQCASYLWSLHTPLEYLPYIWVHWYIPALFFFLSIKKNIRKSTCGLHRPDVFFFWIIQFGWVARSYALIYLSANHLFRYIILLHKYYSR